MKRKFKAYSLWLKWGNLGWRIAATCKNVAYPGENPRSLLMEWAASHYPSKWGCDWRRKVRILPEGKRPRDAR